MLKCQFHTHVKGDFVDRIPHTAEELIERASELKYDVLAITCHKTVIFNDHLKSYADKKGILLIPGIELSINKVHVLILNCDNEIKNIDSFDHLREYKKNHPNCLVVAPHPFFPGKLSLKNLLEKNIDLFDAIEHCFCYTKYIDFNKKALILAKKYNKPMIATSDCHVLKYLDSAYTILDCEKNPDSIIQAIKQNKTQREHRPISHLAVGKIIATQTIRNLFN